MPAVQPRVSSPAARRASRATPAVELAPVSPAAEPTSEEQVVAAELRNLEEMSFAILQERAASYY